MPRASQQSSPLLNYAAIARPDHWFKQVFCLPGVALAIAIEHPEITVSSLWHVLVGLVAVCLTCSSNYVINEILDAPYDLAHPQKRDRPIPAGRVNVGLAYLEWLVLGALGMTIAWFISVPFFATVVAIWVMALIYNVPPLRAKELPVGDVLTESVNNPLRFLMGWYAIGGGVIAPLSLICASWMLGAFWMTAKRFAEYRHIGDKQIASEYRRCFKVYNESRLSALMVFFVSSFSLFLGVFLIKYRVELILSVPFIAVFVAVYWHTSLLPNSPVQHPEALYRVKRLMLTCVALALVGGILLFVDIPWLGRLFEVGPPV